MKKAALLIIGSIALAAGAFFGGMAAAKSSPSGKTAGDSPAVSKNEPYASEDNKQTESEKTPVNVFFSPHTGNDETGDGSQQNPFASEEKAREHAKNLDLRENEEAVILEFLMSVEVRTQASYGVSSEEGTVNMIPFTGSSDGYYFKGEIAGAGCDTQMFGIEGRPAFSARYLLKGVDCRGRECSIFIENNGDSLDKCTPTIITDSAALSDWQTADLRTIVTPVGFGVIVDCYKIH